MINIRTETIILLVQDNDGYRRNPVDLINESGQVEEDNVLQAHCAGASGYLLKASSSEETSC